MEFIESFMKFSFSDDDIFRIEEDELVKDVENVKACECVVLISENVALIEAKSSSPRIENEEKFQKFISDIGQKFADSLQLFFVRPLLASLPFSAGIPAHSHTVKQRNQDLYLPCLKGSRVQIR